MHRCLQVPEVLSRVADGLQRGEAFRFAMTCKTFLEPGLDGVWRNIASFDSLIACLPADLWIEDMPPPQGSHAIVLNLQRDLTYEALHRYITYYAPRIRTISFTRFGKKIPSTESFRAMELATEFQPGALSPRLKEFRWFDALSANHYFGESLSKFLSSSMFLFVGGTVEVLRASVSRQEPRLHRASVDLSIKRLSVNLKKLTISGEQRIHHCLKSFSWPRLRAVSLTDAPKTAIPRLASLPCLEHLEINGFSKEDLPPEPRTIHGFYGLRTLSVTSRCVLDVKPILQYLPPSNVLEELYSEDWNLKPSQQELQDVLITLREQCNPATLARLAFSAALRLHGGEPTEFDDSDEIDLSPLYPFNRLQDLSLRYTRKVLVSPDIVTKIPTMWPRLRSLVLCPSLCSSHIPLINHEDIVRLVDSLPSLRELGLQFDATRVPERQQHKPGRTSKLRTLRVGVSPICSPSRAVTFLRYHFPFLESLDTTHYGGLAMAKLYIARWQVVLERWNTSRLEPSGLSFQA